MVNYMSQILIELIKLANLIINLTKAFAASGRIQDIFDIEPGMAEGNTELNLVNDNNLNDVTGKLAGENDSDNKLKNPENYNKDIAVEFENATFRHLGIEEGKDQVKGVEFLKSLPYVDGNRIGVHGWSFGGHMTTALLLPRYSR